MVKILPNYRRNKLNQQYATLNTVKPHNHPREGHLTTLIERCPLIRGEEMNFYLKKDNHEVRHVSRKFMGKNSSYTCALPLTTHSSSHYSCWLSFFINFQANKGSILLLERVEPVGFNEVGLLIGRITYSFC